MLLKLIHSKQGRYVSIIATLVNSRYSEDTVLLLKLIHSKAVTHICYCTKFTVQQVHIIASVVNLRCHLHEMLGPDVSKLKQYVFKKM